MTRRMEKIIICFVECSLKFDLYGKSLDFKTNARQSYCFGIGFACALIMPTFAHQVASIFLVCCLCFLFSDSLYISNHTQPLDHFGARGGPYAHLTFQQQYAIIDDDWGGAQNKAPILVFLGGAAPIMSDVGHTGVLTEAAPRLRALLVYIEHRFYGTSVPSESIDAALASSEVRSFLTSKQALADFADLIVALKKNLSATESPVIVLGCSYGGMLAAWFRLKYPHIVIGALASSAPILFSESTPPMNDFCSIVSRDFEQKNENCLNIIRRSWDTIDQFASRIFGLSVLSRTFNFCRPLLSSLELKKFLARTYMFAAQSNGRDNNGINIICNTIVGTPTSDTGLEGIAAAVASIYSSHQSCIDMNTMDIASSADHHDKSAEAWDWQQCNEIYVHKNCAEDNSMRIPQEAVDDQSEHIEYCLKKYATSPRVPNYYGGQDVIKGASHIVFSNGLVDPYSSLGILNDLSDTILTVNTEEGSQCLDMYSAEEDDPKWLKNQRKKEVHILKDWINGTAPRTPGKAITIILAFTTFLLVYVI